MCDNYEEKLSAEIMTRNYELVYYVAQNVGIIGILPYPKKLCESSMISNILKFTISCDQIIFYTPFINNNLSFIQFFIILVSFDSNICNASIGLMILSHKMKP